MHDLAFRPDVLLQNSDDAVPVIAEDDCGMVAEGQRALVRCRFRTAVAERLDGGPFLDELDVAKLNDVAGDGYRSKA